MPQKNSTSITCPEAFHSSPFHLETDWIIKTENKNRNCTHAEIDELNAKGILNFIDFKIMELLAVHKAINTYNLNYALSFLLPECYQHDTYTRNFKKLAKAGIILKHALYNRKADGTYGTVQSPLRFYSLSPGGYSYIAPILSSSHRLNGALNDYKMLEQLALSQLLLHLPAAFNGSICHMAKNVIKNIGSHKLCIDCFFRYQTDAVPASPVSIFLFCCRTHPASHKDCLTRILLFFRWLSSHRTEHPTFLIIIVVEHSQDILNLHRSIMAYSTPVRYPIYYTTDNDQLCAPFYENLYQCTFNDEASQFQLEHISLSF